MTFDPEKNEFKKLEISHLISKQEEIQWSTLAKWLINCHVVVIFANLQHLFLIGHFIRTGEVCILTIEKRRKTEFFEFEVLGVKGNNFEKLTFVNSKLGRA